jgi:hypothetical protein
MLMLRPLGLVMHWAFKGHRAHVFLGKWTIPPGWKDISCSATQIGPINMQFFQRDLLPLQVSTDLSSDIGLWHIRRRNADRTDEPGIQIVEHVPFVSIHADTSALPPVTHLRILDADAPIFRYAFDQASFAVFVRVPRLAR